MEETKVDDLLMEMIQPKVQEIETRFSKGEGLSNTDINTLLLKSQYNHINHLDKKLDEITATVVNLEYRFSGLENKFSGLENKFSGLENKFDSLKNELKNSFALWEAKFGVLENKFDALENSLENKFSLHETKIGLKMQRAINVNMRWGMAMIAFIVTALKVIDTIFMK